MKTERKNKEIYEEAEELFESKNFEEADELLKDIPKYKGVSALKEKLLLK